MPEHEEPDGAQDPRSFWHAEIKRLREKAGWLQEDLAREINVSEDYVSRLERGVRPPTRELSIRLDQALKTDGHFVRLFVLLESAGTIPSFFAYVAETLKTAARIEAFEPNLMPGLLQTPEYAREVFKAVWPYRAPEKIQSMVDDRMGLASILDREDRPEFWTILGESVIRDVLPCGVMRDQLVHVLDMAEQGKVVVQLLPADVGMHALKTGSLWILTSDDGSQLAYTEGPHAGHTMDSPAELANCRRSYDLVRAAALPPVASLARIRTALEELKHHGD
ncbi:Scr1 family TA system antitoxin-like transcriptional regulator [Streptomyces sp. NPDC021093]|uniref:helix-turn-helix domain-containing protein n=1 Tax=Streptomyces sp. NPDC021093 TaxID=3365112 RepID=UPI0037B69F78